MTLHEFYKGRRVLVTGHTGFKGTWLCEILLQLGAEVTGYALAPNTEPDLFTLTGMAGRMNSVIGDIRDYESLKKCFDAAKPEVVFHLAAQPIVKEGYRDPVGTYHTNAMGTVHVMDCIRACPSVISVVNVTTDKVYAETGKASGYQEGDTLDGFDPYANSKSCSELVTACYRRSFLEKLPVSTARAGNVIGGGDFAPNRIIPDCVRAAIAGEDIVLRNPYSIRPYQHVLEPLLVYLTIAMKQWEDPALAGSYNVGPDAEGCVTTGELAELFCNAYGGMSVRVQPDNGPHEASFLKLDCALLKEKFGWKPSISVSDAVELTVEWTKVWQSGASLLDCMSAQINHALKK